MMKKIVFGAVLALASTGAFAHDIEVEIANLDTKENIALGLSGSALGVQLEASTAYAGSVAVDASCDCEMDVGIYNIDTKQNIALGDAAAGSIVISSTGSPMRGGGPR